MVLAIGGGSAIDAAKAVAALSVHDGKAIDYVGVAPLSAFGVSVADLPGIIAGSRAGSMRSNPVELTDAELSEILTDALVQG